MQTITGNLLTKNFSETKNYFDKLIIGFTLAFVFSSSYSIAITQITYFTALAIWLAKMIYERKYSFKSTPFDYYFLAFLAAEGISTILSHDVLQSLYGFHKRLVIIPIIYLLGYWLNNRDRLQLFILTFIISAFILSLYGIVKVIVFFDEFVAHKRRLDLFQFSMTTSGLFVIAIMMILSFTMHQKIPKNLRLLGIITLIPLLTSLVFTFQRGSWLGFILGTIVIAFQRSKKLLIIFILSIVLLVIFSPPWLQSRMSSILDPTEEANQHRLNMWQTGWRIVQDHPIFGVGDIGLEEFFPKYGKPGEKPWGHMHSNIMTWLVRIGIVGLICAILLFIKMFVVFFKASAKDKDDWLINSILIGVVAALTAFSVSGLFEYNFGDTEVIMYLFINCGFALAAIRIAKIENRILTN